MAQVRAESRHRLPTMVLGTGLPCLSLGTQDKYSSDAQLATKLRREDSLKGPECQPQPLTPLGRFL